MKAARESCNSLTNYVPYPQRPLVGRSVAAEEVNRHSWQGDADANQRVDGVAVERHHHQEDGEETEDDGIEETQLRNKDRGRKKIRDDGLYHDNEYETWKVKILTKSIKFFVFEHYCSNCI